MGCCNKEKNNNSTREYPDGLDPCCYIRGERCFCLPYDDPYLITSQVVSIVATLVSWIWWVTLVISAIGMLMFQFLWCCRQSRSALLSLAAVAMVCALANIGVAIYVFEVWSRVGWCEPFTFYNDDHMSDDYQYYVMTIHDYCTEKIWGTIALVCGILWIVAFGCIVRFVTSGKHAKWEEMYGATTNNDNDNDNDNTTTEAVELGRVPPASVPEALPVPAEPATVSGAIPLAESKEIEG